MTIHAFDQLKRQLPTTHCWILIPIWDKHVMPSDVFCREIYEFTNCNIKEWMEDTYLDYKKKIISQKNFLRYSSSEKSRGEDAAFVVMLI